MKHTRLFVLASSLLLLASCGGNSSSPAASSPAAGSSNTPAASSVTPAASSDTTPSSSSSLAPTVSSLKLDVSKLEKKVYFYNPLQAKYKDSVDPKGLAVTAKMSDNTEEAVNLADCTITADLSTAGENDVTVSYGGASATFKVKVGVYSVTAATIDEVEGKAIVSFTGTYSGVTDAEFLANTWSGDFQKNGYNGGSWNGPWTRHFADSFTPTAADGAFKVEVDVTNADVATYIGHFGHKLISTDQDKDVPMDNKVNAEADAFKAIRIGDVEYRMDYNLGKDGNPEYNYGNLGLTVKEIGAPTYAIAPVHLVKGAEDKPTLRFTVNFENYVEADFRALAWGFDLEQNGDYSGGTWGGVKLSDFEMGKKWVINNGVATYDVALDALAPGGYTLHFGVGKNGDKAPDFKVKEFSHDYVNYEGNRYSLVGSAGAGNAGSEFWGNYGVLIDNADFYFNNAKIADVEGAPVVTFSGTAKTDVSETFKMNYQNSTTWSAAVANSTATYSDGQFTCSMNLSAAENGNLIFKKLDPQIDIDHRNGWFLDFEPMTITVGAKVYELTNMVNWDRNFVVVKISDAPAA
ncbi:MAG: bacterial Ig-like domain-containing protein [Bacilli bacterium]|nr:bacterial Ig-like domain-containing protein [Bacilli bacterium]